MGCSHVNDLPAKIAGFAIQPGEDFRASGLGKLNPNTAIPGTWHPMLHLRRLGAVRTRPSTSAKCSKVHDRRWPWTAPCWGFCLQPMLFVSTTCAAACDRPHSIAESCRRLCEHGAKHHKTRMTTPIPESTRRILRKQLRDGRAVRAGRAKLRADLPGLPSPRAQRLPRGAKGLKVGGTCVGPGAFREVGAA